jgi:hypothetical protein
MEEVVGSIPTRSTKFLNNLNSALASRHEVCVATAVAVATSKGPSLLAFVRVLQQEAYGVRGTNDSMGGIEKDVVKACSRGWAPS